MTQDPVAAFFELLFGDLDGGFIEVRQIEDKRGGQLRDRRWYGTASELLDDLPRLKTRASNENLAVFFGVLPRRAKGCGKAGDTLPGRIVWVDVDFKDFTAGESEARKRISQFPSPPSVVVRSGHGLHLYWHLREPTDPPELSDLSRALARALGGDHAFDAARILRAPGTFNRKDPAHPILVDIETFAPDHVWNASEIVEALEIVGASTDAVDRGVDGAPPVGGDLEIGDRLSDAVLALLDKFKFLKELFEGKGKLAVSDDGKKLDTSSSGYDFTLVLRLAQKGVTDPSELGTSIWHRPDGAAQAKGVKYIQRTVEQAVQRATAATVGPAPTTDFRIEHVRAFTCVPARYEFAIEGVTLTLTSEELKSPDRFTTRFLDTHRRIPDVPSKKAAWRQLVNGWLKSAETVELPPEASDEQALREDIERTIDGLPVGEGPLDLDHNKALDLDGKRAFKASSLLRTLREQWPDLRRQDLCRILGDLGWVSITRRISGTSARVWCHTEDPGNAREEEK